MGITYDFKSGRFFRGNGREVCYWNGSARTVVTIAGERYTAARFAWLAFYGTEPIGNVTTWNGDPADLRILNLRDTGITETNLHGHVVIDRLGGLIFRRSTNEELFKHRRVEYVAGMRWTFFKMLDELGIKPNLMPVHHAKWGWVVTYRGRIVAKRFDSWERAMGWIEANNQNF